MPFFCVLWLVFTVYFWEKKKLAKRYRHFKLLLLATWSPFEACEGVRANMRAIPKRTWTRMAVNIPTSHKKTTRLDLTCWIPKALYFSGLSICLAFVSLKLLSFWAVWRSSDKRGRLVSQYPKGHVKEVKILTSRSPCEYVLALRKQKT